MKRMSKKASNKYRIKVMLTQTTFQLSCLKKISFILAPFCVTFWPSTTIQVIPDASTISSRAKHIKTQKLHFYLLQFSPNYSRLSRRSLLTLYLNEIWHISHDTLSFTFQSAFLLIHSIMHFSWAQATLPRHMHGCTSRPSFSSSRQIRHYLAVDYARGWPAVLEIRALRVGSAISGDGWGLYRGVRQNPESLLSMKKSMQSNALLC